MKNEESNEKELDNFFRVLNIEFLIHELKNPVSVVETSVRSLLEKPETFGPLNARQQRILDRALRNVRKTREMLYHLLEIGRSQCRCLACDRFDPVQSAVHVIFETLETVCGPVLEMDAAPADPETGCDLFRQYGIYLNIQSELTAIRMVHDEVKYRQILSNLVKNGLHHRKKRLEIGMTLQDERLYLEVADDGPGIKPAHYDTIFERYTRLEAAAINRSGHGLGLAGARTLARAMGGDVAVVRTPGRGAVFRLTLPMIFKNESPQR